MSVFGSCPIYSIPMTRNHPEKILQLMILNQLKLHRLAGDILWFQTLAAESDVNCRAGTPDIISVVNCKDGTISLLFIEVKRPGIKKLRYEQQEFFNSMSGKPRILCVLINDVSQLWPAINKAKKL